MTFPFVIPSGLQPARNLLVGLLPLRQLRRIDAESQIAHRNGTHECVPLRFEIRFRADQAQPQRLKPSSLPTFRYG